MTDSSRRVFIQAAAGASLVAASGMAGKVQAAEDKKGSGGAFDYQHTPVPLPFDRKGLNGISEN